MAQVQDKLQPSTTTYKPKVDNFPFVLPKTKKAKLEYSPPISTQPFFEEEYPLSIPILTKPSSLLRKKRPSIEYEAIKQTQLCYNLHADELLLDKLDLQSMSNTVTKLHMEFLEELRKLAEEVEKTGGWKDLSHLLEHINFFITLAMGTFLLTQGEVDMAAKMMMLTAGLGIANKFMQKSCAYEKLASYLTASEENKKRYAAHLETTFILLSLGIGLFQNYASYGRGINVLSQMPNNDQLEFVRNALSYSSLIAKTFTDSMQYYHSANAFQHAALSKTHEAEETFLKDQSSRITAQVGKGVKTQEALIQTLKEIMQSKPIITR